MLDLAYLAPGVSQPPGQAYGNAGGGIQNNFVSNGGRNSQADILIDGITATSYEQNTGFVTPLYVPSVEAVQEFNIEESNFGAQIGFSSGTVINLVTRSGTNAIHGELYDFVRNTDFNANYFFNNASGIPTPVYHQNNYGVDVGGPVLKNKLFYFFDYDGTRNSTPVTGTFGVPSAAERTGNFGELCGNHGGSFNGAGLCSVQAGQLFDPYTGTAAPVANPYGGTLQYSNLGNPAGGVRQNYIPFNNFNGYASPNTAGSPGVTPGVRGNLINPIASKVMSFFPLPNTGGTPGTSGYNPYNNFNGSASSASVNNQYDIKLDNRFTDNDQISIRFSQQWGNSQIGNIFGNALDSYTQGPTTGITYSGAVNYTHTFNPTTVLTLIGGYDHNFANTAGNQVNYPSVTAQSLGFPASVASQLNTSGYDGLPAFRLSSQYSNENGNASIGGQPYSGLIYGRDVYQAGGNLSKIVGNHNLQFGAEFRSHRINFTQFGEPNGLFSFNQGGTSQYASIGGDALASFLTGFANDWSAYEIPASPATQNLQYGGFIQDNWHVNDRLTLNIGVRYDIDAPRTERYDRMSYFDLSAPSPLAGTPGLPNLGSIEYVGQNGNGSSPYGTYYGAVGPRFGFAYRVGDNWTIRGGYGLYYDPSKYGAAGTGSGGAGFLGYDQQTTQSAFANNNITPTDVLGQPLNITPVQGNSLGTKTNLGAQINGVPIYQYNTLPSEQTWSFGIQRTLPFNVLIDAEYVGRKGTHLYLGGDTYATDHLSQSVATAFQANPGAYTQFVPIPTAIKTAVTANTPAFSNPITYNNTWPAFNASLPFPQYPFLNGNGGLTNVEPPIANSIYNAFQLKVQKRMSKGLQFLFTYAVQKSIDDSSIAGSNVYIDGYSGATLASIQDPNNLSLERALSAFDISQVAQITGVYQLPFGKGKTFGSNWNGVVDAFLGGWQVNGIYRWDTGLPLIYFLNGGTSLPTYGAQRPNLPEQLQLSGVVSPNTNYFSNAAGAAQPPVAVAEPAGYTGPVCYTSPWIPCQYALGDAPRVASNLRQQGTNNVTASIFKQFPLGFREGASLEFRAEVFNLFNRVQFGAPATTVGQSNFGMITSQANTPREMQLAIKLYF